MRKCNTHLVIMAGGIGSRFWPMSTSEMPKQFVDILGIGKTMIELTVDRFSSLCPVENIWVVTGESYVPIVRRLLPGISADHILAEPVGRGTAPCVAYACWKIRLIDPEANIAFTPSDAFIADVPAFCRVMEEAFAFTAERRAIVTVGIRPTRPETGYGYIHVADAVAAGSNVARVAEFKEKPQLETAEAYLADGSYLWNAGIFVWNVNTVIEELRLHAPALAENMDRMALDFFTEKEQETVRRLFPLCEKISIDYAVMEKASCIFTVPADCGWTDLGTWGSLRQQLSLDETGNAVVGEHTRLIDSKGCIVHTSDFKEVIIQGLDDCIVAAQNGRLLICRLDHEQKITDYIK